MIRSMTGYGRGEHMSNERRFKVEIKSVNHRYGDITVKLPRFLNHFEDSLRKRVAKDVTRGKVDVFVNYESFSERDIRININTVYADIYEKALGKLADRYDLPDGVTLSLLAAYPDVFIIEKNELNDRETQDEIWETLSKALEKALAVFNVMREHEGAALKRDLTEKRENMRVLLERIKKRAPAVAEEYAVKLRERVTEALEGRQVDEGRLLTEITLFADRASIDEEITRLDSHIVQLGEILNEPSNVGRKLDFLAQELNREANTIGSKSNDTALTRIVVELKNEIEKIREQVQNIE